MDARLHLFGENLVYRSLSLYGRLPFKGLANQDDVKMAAAIARTGMSSVCRALIDDVQFDDGREGFPKALLYVSAGVDGIAGIHGP
jgi:hypothetical protein